MVKFQFNKNWTWINEIEQSDDIKDKEIDIVYRLDINPCHPGTCKTNCSANLYCLNGIGEKKLVNLIHKESNLTIERCEYFRNLDEYAGLKNLGATCYINTYLQVWFNNLFFREFILQISFDKLKSDKSSDQEITKIASAENNELSPPNFQVIQSQCIGKNLQLIFSLMKESIRKSLDTNFFIKALGLDENMQQDAQEFSQLFLTTLQNTLSKLNVSSGFQEQHQQFFKTSNKNNLINDLFKGKYSYITECSSCRLQSIRSSDFLELSLNIQNSTTIIDCLNDLLKDEIMDGDNQYYCDTCQRKCNAKRMTKLDQLPPVLNLQLLRFVYDRNSGYKKKLSAKIKFSEQLDLKQFSQQAQTVYNLGAILMHCGKTAYSGHYMAQIKNLQTNKWYQFNDEVISELKKKQLLGCTEDETEKQNQSVQDDKQSKTFSTSNAYLLVYYRSDLFQQMKQIDTSKLSNQHEIILNDNSKLENWFANLKSTKQNEFESKNAERETINNIYNSLWLDSSMSNNKFDSYLVSTDFLRKLLTCQNNINLNETANGCSIQKYICQHNKLNPLMINKLKLISSNGYKNLKEIYATKINDLDSLFLKTYDDSKTRCRECVYNCFEYLKCKERLKSDMKCVRMLLKNEPLIDDASKINTNDLNLNNLNINPNKKEEIIIDENIEVPVLNATNDNDKSDDGNKNYNKVDENDEINENKENSSPKNTLYWVGKETLKVWQSLALRRYESQLPTMKSNEEIDENPTQMNDHEAKTLEKDGIEIIETKQEKANSNEKTSSSTTQTTNSNGNNNRDQDLDTESQSLSYFNEDIVCPHGNLLPGQNKRLISHKIWSIIFEKYFNQSDVKVYTNESRECRLCQKINEEAASKNSLVKIQKDNLLELFNNKQRPYLANLQLNTEYYLIHTEFVKEWRSMVKQTKFKDIKIYNQAIVCPHNNLPFNENSIDSSMVTLLTSREWRFLSDNFIYDIPISVIKTQLCETEMSAAEASNEKFNFIFEPKPCELCLEKNALDKYLFENKKIFIRLIDDEDLLKTDSNSKAINYNNTEDNEAKNNDDIIELPQKKSRLDDFEIASEQSSKHSNDSKESKLLKLNINQPSKPLVLTSSSSSATSGVSLSGTRRSKRARRLKGDIEIVASSYDTIKQIKIKIVPHLNRMISEQHLFFRGDELENDKTLAEYKINQTDILILQIDKTIDDDFEGPCYENAHLPEIGFKGTNLTG